jgi:hypothetical protein
METGSGDYLRLREPEGKRFSAQDFFIRLAEGRDSVDCIPAPAWDPEPVAAPLPAPAASARPQRRKAAPKQPEPAA